MKSYELNTIDGLIARYSGLGLKTSTSRYSTGPDETAIIGELWDKEVRRTSQAFRFTQWTLSHCLNIRTSMILQHDNEGNPVHDNGELGPSVSDDFLRELLFNDDAQTLVSMIERRDTYNCQVVQIARYPLDDTTISSLEMLVNLDNEYRIEHPDANE